MLCWCAACSLVLITTTSGSADLCYSVLRVGWDQSVLEDAGGRAGLRRGGGLRGEQGAAAEDRGRHQDHHRPQRGQHHARDILVSTLPVSGYDEW